jgi:hypothetical protein
MSRLVLAFLVAPLVGLMAGAIVEIRPLRFEVIVGFVTYGAIGAYPVALLVGLPAILFLRHFNRLSLAWLLGLATTLVLIFWCAIQSQNSGPLHLEGGNLTDGLVVVLGATAFFWLLGVRGNLKLAGSGHAS